MIARHCFAEHRHRPHEWQSFGVGNGGVWLCDGSPVLVLRRESDGAWRDPRAVA